MWQVELGITRYKAIKLEAGILKPDGRLEGALWPFKNPSLPTDFYNVRDAKTAIAFSLQYAPLGYDSLSDEKKGGDPLDWVLEHARFVRFALDLIYAFGKRDSSRLLELIRDNTREVQLIDTEGKPVRSPIPGIFDIPRLLLSPIGSDYHKSIMWLPARGGECLGEIPSLVAGLINENTQEMRQELWLTEFLWVRKFRSLIEVIWSMVGDIAVKSAHENESLRRCKWCDAVFQVTHKRQRFCPPIESPYYSRQQSACGLRYRQDKLRNKKRGAQNNQ